MGHQMRLELTLIGLLIKLANHYATRDTLAQFPIDHFSQPVMYSFSAVFAYVINRFLSVYTLVRLAWFYGTSTIIDYLMPNPFLCIQTVLFQTIQFTISTQFRYIWPIDKALSSATTPGQSVPGSVDNEGVLRIHQRSSITRASPADCLVSYPGHLLGGGSYSYVEVQLVYSTAPVDWAIGHSLGGGSYPSAEMQLVYSTAQVDWAIGHSLGGGGLTPLQRCS